MTKKNEMALTGISLEARAVVAVSRCLSINPDFNAETLAEAAKDSAALASWCNRFAACDPRAFRCFVEAARFAKESGELVDALLRSVTEGGDHAE